MGLDQAKKGITAQINGIIMKQGLSIIIVNFNGAEFIENCVVSFQHFLLASNIEHEFLIIDNASTDDSISVIKELALKLPYIRPFFSKINHGFGKANNLLATEASYATIVLLNNDTYTLDLTHLCDLTKRHLLNKDTVYTCAILNSDHSKQKNSFGYPRLTNVGVDLFLLKKPLFFLYKKLFKSKLDVVDGYYSGCYLVMNLELFNRSGGFDVDFFFYHEECDLFLRLEKIGIKKVRLQDSIIHYGSGGAGISDFSFKNYYTNLARLLIKNGYGSPRLIKSIFRLAFKFRMLLLSLGCNIPYSPFAHMYKNSTSAPVLNSQIIRLHKETLVGIDDLYVKENT